MGPVQVAPNIQGRLWRSGEPQDDFEVARLADYLGEPDALVRVDLCDPDHGALCELAAELGLNSWAVQDAVAASERVKATAYATHTFFTAYAVDVVAEPASAADAGGRQFHSASPSSGRGRPRAGPALRRPLRPRAARVGVDGVAARHDHHHLRDEYGQNVPYPGFGTPAGLLASSGVMVILMVALYVLFRRRDRL